MPTPGGRPSVATAVMFTDWLLLTYQERSSGRQPMSSAAARQCEHNLVAFHMWQLLSHATRPLGYLVTMCGGEPDALATDLLLLFKPAARKTCPGVLIKVDALFHMLSSMLYGSVVIPDTLQETDCEASISCCCCCCCCCCCSLRCLDSGTTCKRLIAALRCSLSQ